VFANGVRLLSNSSSGLPVRITRVRPDRGHLAVAVDGMVTLLAHVPVDVSPPVVGDRARVVFDPALSAVLPKIADRMPRETRPGACQAP
jgi:hypothetical protein